MTYKLFISILFLFFYSHCFGNSINELTTRAKQGYVDAQFQLGFMYHFGNQVTQNYQEALKWYTLAAEQGYVDAQYILGVMYYGVTNNNYKKAFKWFLLAAEQDHTDAQYHLGKIYYNGYEITQNYQEALKWFALAAEQSKTDTVWNHLSWMYYENVSKAQNKLGEIYYFGDGVTQNYQEAFKWFLLAAEQNNLDASTETYNQVVLGYMYFHGKGTYKNYQEALKWYTLAAEQGHIIAQFKLGEMYYKGNGVTQNSKKALKWFALAAEQGYPEAQVKLGVMYFTGQGTIKNFQKAYTHSLIANYLIEYLTELELLEVHTILDSIVKNYIINDLSSDKKTVQKLILNLESKLPSQTINLVQNEASKIVEKFK